MYQPTNDFVTFFLSLIASHQLLLFFHLLFLSLNTISRDRKTEREREKERKRENIYTCRDTARGRKYGQMKIYTRENIYDATD